MSAIAGAVHVDGRPIDERLLVAMAAAAAPRGFDGVVHWHDDNAGLICFAHATTPESVGETQPFVSARSGAALMISGRIDNRDELIAAIGAGPGLTHEADGAIALAAFDRFGDGFVERVVGDFAIAIWSSRERRLLLLRSAAGWQPLLWCFDGRRFGFASEPRTLVLGLGLERRLNEGALGEYLATRFTTPTETFWQGIERVPPGGAIELRGKCVRRWQWLSGPIEDLSHLSAEAHVERFAGLFDQALIAVSRASTPIAAQLSGGLDSSSVVARLTELHRAGRVDRQVRPISARFPGQPHDETGWSSAVERHVGITSAVVGAAPFDIDAAARWCAASYQLPVRPNALATLGQICARVQADGGRVLLTGEGGDEWFDGTTAHWPDLVLSGRWGDLIRDGIWRWPRQPASLAGLRALYHGLLPIVSRRRREAMFHPLGHLGTSPVPAWIRPDWARAIDLRDRLHLQVAPQGVQGFAQRSRFIPFVMPRRFVNGEAPRAFAEAHGVEIRHPFYDQRLARFAIGADGIVLRRFGEKRHVLREAMRSTLPEMVRTRRTKTSFSGPIIAAVDAVLAERPFETMRSVAMGWTEPKQLAALHEPYRRWRRDGAVGEPPVGKVNALWCVIATELWLDHAFGL